MSSIQGHAKLYKDFLRDSTNTSIQFYPLKRDRVAVPFQLINNLVVIKLSLNNSSPLNFILDTGVRRTIISELPQEEQLSLVQIQKVALRGLGGDQPIMGFRSPGNQIKLHETDVEATNAEVIILEQDLLHLSKIMGTYVHGIIGYDLFSSFMVEIDYQKKRLVLYESNNKKKMQSLAKSKHWHQIPISIEEQKAFINIPYKHSQNDAYRSVKLLIDTGSSSALTIYSPDQEIPKPLKNLSGRLGVGLGGEVFGQIGRIADAKIGPYHLNEPIVTYPDSSAAHDLLVQNRRNGSIGSDVFNRFKVIINFQEEVLLIRARKSLTKSFDYNASGIEISTPYPNLPVYIINRIRPGSVAERVGLKVGDQIERIHGESVFNKKLSEVVSYFKKGINGRIRLQIIRDSIQRSVLFSLEKELEVDA